MKPRNDADIFKKRGDFAKKGGTFLLILVLNISTMIFIGGVVVIPAFLYQLTAPPMAAVKWKPQPPPPKPPKFGEGKGAHNLLDPSVVIQPPPSISGVIATRMPSTSLDFKLSLSNIPATSLPNLSYIPSGTLANESPQAQGIAEVGDSLFGIDDSQGTPMFEGTLYDFKQTSHRRPTGYTRYDYHKALMDFVSSNWDESLLRKFFKFPKVLFTPQIFIPNMQAEMGPKEFGAENDVAPKEWIVDYKATVVPSESGQYQFYGRCDDILLVRVNNDTVLDGSLVPVAPPGVNEGAPRFNLLDPTPALNRNLALPQGKPFTVTEGVPIKINVIIGEEPGGWFNAFLLLGKVGVPYETSTGRDPKIPVFQVAPAPVPNSGTRVDAGPPIVWPARSAQ